MTEYTIKPGWLVSLKTRLVGGVSYQTEDLGQEREGAALTSEWRTKKHVDDVAELERATDTRSKSRSLIAGACIQTPFGLLCPEDQGEALASRLADAQRLVTEHNASAAYTRVELYILRGRIASDDREAVRAIFSDIRQAVSEMQAGIAALDVAQIRDAAQRARNLGRMLDAGQAERVNKAVDAARKAARVMVRQIDDAGQASLDAVMLEVSTKPIDDLRFAFLDLEGGDSGPDGVPAVPAVPVAPADVRAVDMSATADSESDSAAPSAAPVGLAVAELEFAA